MIPAGEPPGNSPAGARARLRGWPRLVLGLGALWFLAFVVLPWAAGLAPVRPVMESVAASGIGATQYFYTQSEETARAQAYVSSALARAPSGTLGSESRGTESLTDPPPERARRPAAR